MGAFNVVFGSGGNGSVVSNGARSGEIDIELIIGDDYLSSNNRSLEWVVEIPTDTTIGDSTCRLTFVPASGTESSSIVFDGIISAIDASAKLSFDMPSLETETIVEGEYFWFVEWLGDAGEQITKVFNRQLVKWKGKL